MYTNVAAGTTTSVGTSYLVLGNNKKSNVAGNAKGYLGLYSNNNKFVQLTAADGMTSNKTITLPDVGGTVALAEKTLPLTGGTLTGALTISDGGINVIGGATIAGTITTKNQVVLLYNGLGRIYTAASQVQLEARKENANTNRMVFQVCQGDDVSTYARLLKYTTNPSTASDKYQIYGSHNITKGTSPLTAGTSELTTNFIYLQYE